AIRIAIGLVEGPEIAELHRRRASFHYVWDWQERFPGERILTAGLLGRSGTSVVYLTYVDNVSDQDLRLVARRFPHLLQFQMTDQDVTIDGVAALRRCRRLELLTLSRCPIDDAMLAELAGLTQMKCLDLSGTLITDASLSVLQGFPLLEEVDVWDTDLT